MVKVAIIGAQSTGKSLRAKDLSKKGNLLLMPEVARSCPLPINKEASRNTQLYIFATQLQKEIEQMVKAEKSGMNGIVCDRSLLDTLVYSIDGGFDDITELLLPLTRKWMNTYTKIYWCRPAKGSFPENDGIRCSDFLWQKKIDRIFEKLIKDIFCLNVEIINDKKTKISVDFKYLLT